MVWSIVYKGATRRDALNQLYVATLKLDIVPKLWDGKVEAAIPRTFRTAKVPDITIFHTKDIY
jgi:hypothetical protein